MANTITAKKDTVIYLVNADAEQAKNIALFPDNTPFTLAPNTAISIKVDSAREYLFYLSQGATEDAPAEAITKIIEAEKDKVLVITNGKDALQNISLYPDNTPFTFGIGDVLNIEVKTAREYIYYVVTAQMAGLTVTEQAGDGQE